MYFRWRRGFSPITTYFCTRSPIDCLFLSYPLLGRPPTYVLLLSPLIAYFLVICITHCLVGLLHTLYCFPDRLLFLVMSVFWSASCVCFHGVNRVSLLLACGGWKSWNPKRKDCRVRLGGCRLVSIKRLLKRLPVNYENWIPLRFWVNLCDPDRAVKVFRKQYYNLFNGASNAIGQRPFIQQVR